MIHSLEHVRRLELPPLHFMEVHPQTTAMTLYAVARDQLDVGELKIGRDEQWV